MRSKPVLTSSRIDHSSRTSAEIDALVSERLHEHEGIYALNNQLLADLKPDLILTQELCEVCAVSYEQVERAVRAIRGDQTVLSLEPNDLAGILETVATVGAATGRTAEAETLIMGIRDRLDQLKASTSELSQQPRVACLEWIDPPFSGGHWVPEMVDIAGGIDVLAAPGERSRRIAWADVAAARPDVVVIMPCGFDVDGTLSELRQAPVPPEWNLLPAVTSGQVYAVDANAYFSRPGPRIIRGIEILREIFVSSHSGAQNGDGWARAL